MRITLVSPALLLAALLAAASPPMHRPPRLATAAAARPPSWPVTYKNVFALGDVAAVPMGKTGGSARKQYNVVAENLISVMEKERSSSCKI